MQDNEDALKLIQMQKEALNQPDYDVFFLPDNYYNNYNYKNFGSKLLNMDPGTIKCEEELMFPNLYKINQQNNKKKRDIEKKEESAIEHYKYFL